MSRTEEDARAPLTALMTAALAEFSPQQLRTVAEWLTLKLIVAEHDNPPDATITAEERTAFYEARAIPSPLRLWVFDCGAERWRSTYYRNSQTIARLPAKLDPHTKTTSSVALGMGEVVALSIYDRSGALQPTLTSTAGAQIWPLPDHPLQWPPVTRLTDAEATHLAQTLERFAASGAVQMFPPPDGSAA